MFRSLTGSCSFVPCLLLAVFGCGGEQPGSSQQGAAADAGAAARAPWESLPGVSPAPVRAPAPDPDAAPRAVADGGAEAGDDGHAACVPDDEPDEPDDAFADTDCDGIDGSASHAVFASPGGDDAADGTRTAPVRTVARALTLASEGARSVYLCNGVYAENVRVVEHGARIHGGYDCAHGWLRVRDVAVVAPATGVPLTVRDAGEKVVIDRVAFRAPDATAPGKSSVAASVSHSLDVRLTAVELSAGSGANGADGGPPPISTWQRAADGRDGESSAAAAGCIVRSSGHTLVGPEACTMVARGGASLRSICPGGAAVGGGRGGHGSNYYLSVPPADGEEGVPSALGALSMDGATGADGAPAGLGFGHVEDGAYVASNVGAPGGYGAPGRAGRGGRGGPYSAEGNSDFERPFTPGGGGGEGGSPGCGGKGGAPGRAGGASIALVADTSVVSLRNTLVITGRGGDGGRGTEGGSGQPGGRGGRGGCTAASCTTTGPAHGAEGEPGADGGRGGPGGSGGPGGGGPSIGVVHDGGVTLTGVTFVTGRPGLGGLSASGQAANGVEADVYDVAPAAADAGEGGGQ